MSMTTFFRAAHRVELLQELLAGLLFRICGLVSILVTLGIIGVLAVESSAFFRQVNIFKFIFGTKWTPLFADKQFGILPLVAGTFLVSSIALALAVPAGVIIAVFLSEYASPKVRRTLKPALEILAGVPTVVYGYFALLSVTPFLQNILPNLSGFNALSPGIVMAVMILPLIVSISDDALNAVPRSYRLASYALGSTRFQTAIRVVLPSALSGVIASVILASSRAIGETMLVTIAAGMKPVLTASPLVPVQTMTAYIVQVSLGDTPAGTLEYRSIFVVAAVLFFFTFLLNLVAQKLRLSFAHKYE